MGAWGEGPFDNDDASDFVADVVEAGAADAPAIAGQAMAAVLQGGYVEAPDMSRAIAAAAVVAIGMRPTLPAPVSLSGGSPTGSTPSSDLVSAGAAVFLRAFDGADNEFFELWDDAGLVEEVRQAFAPYAGALG